MRKIEEKYENPFDNFIYYFCENIAEFYYSNGFTPNAVTTISLFFGILAYKNIINHNFKLGALFFMVAYFYDCLDGYIARSYDMVTKFGDYYDHFADFFKFSLALYGLYKVNDKLFMKLLPVILISLILLAVHTGCQEKLYDNFDHSDTLNIFVPLCKIKDKKDLENKINITKYFGFGTVFLLMTLIIFFYKAK